MSVFLDQVTRVSFAIDRTGNLAISSFDSRENNFAALGNVSFRLHGNKIIGTDASAQPVYKYDETLTTDSGGVRNLSNMEWDVYQILMPTPTTYDISGISPPPPINLGPGGSQETEFSINAYTTHSFFITIKSPSLNPIASASAHLFDGGGFDQTKETGISGNPDYGQVLFSGLSEDTYTLEATASGYLDFSGDFDVSGGTTADLVLTPQ